MNLNAAGNIYLRSTTEGALSATIPIAFANTFSLVQAAGVRVVVAPPGMDSPVNLSFANVVLNGATGISFDGQVINVNTLNVTTTMGDIVRGTITAGAIALRAPMGSIGTETGRLRVRANGVDFTSFLASAQTNGGNVYLSSSSNTWVNYIAAMGQNRMMGGGTLSVVLEASPVFVVTDNPTAAATVVTSDLTTTITAVAGTVQLRWRSFNVGVANTVRFVLGTDVLVINEITDQDPSVILGTISAENGRILLRNPNGLYFGPQFSITSELFIAIAAQQAHASWSAGAGAVSVLNYPGLSGVVTVKGALNANRVFLVGRSVEYSRSSTVVNQNGFVVRAHEEVIIRSPITVNDGTIDLLSNSSTLRIQNGAPLEAPAIVLAANGSVSINDPVVVRAASAAVSAPRLTVRSSTGSIGSSAFSLAVRYAPGVVPSASNLVLQAGGDIYLATVAGTNQQGNDLLRASITLGTGGLLSVVQTEGNFLLNAAIPNRNRSLILRALNGGIFGNQTITAPSLLLGARNHVGLSSLPLKINVEGSQLAVSTAFGDITIEHAQDVGSVLAGTITFSRPGSLTLFQTYGSLVVRNIWNRPGIAATLVARRGDIEARAAISASNLTLVASQGRVRATAPLSAAIIRIAASNLIGTTRAPIEVRGQGGVGLPSLRIEQPLQGVAYISVANAAEDFSRMTQIFIGTRLFVTQLSTNTIFERFRPVPLAKDDTVFVELFNVTLSLFGSECGNDDSFASMLEFICSDY